MHKYYILVDDVVLRELGLGGFYRSLCYRRSRYFDCPWISGCRSEWCGAVVVFMLFFICSARRQFLLFYT